MLLAWYTDLATVALIDGPGAEPYDRDKLVRMLGHLAATGELYLIEECDGTGWQPIGDVTLQTYAVPIVLATRRPDGCSPRSAS